MKRKKRRDLLRRAQPTSHWALERMKKNYRRAVWFSTHRVEIRDDRAWYAIAPHGRTERKIERELIAAGFPVYLAVEVVVRRSKRGQAVAERPIVGRYVFVGLALERPEFTAVGTLLRVEEPRPRQLFFEHRGRMHEVDVGGATVPPLGSFVTADGRPLRVDRDSLQAYANALSDCPVEVRDPAHARLAAIMAQADDLRAREADRIWRGEAA